jgi:RNA polymerase primary sigma factor
MPIDERPRPGVAAWSAGWPSVGLENRTRHALATLEPSEAEVLRLRFGIGQARGLTLAQIGLRFALPEVWVRQIETNALRKLRYPSHRRRLDHVSDG